ncbi:glycine betaine ABC transporter substrate-binding protein [Halocynthiibacter styelae]|jgi:glycine betaine/proline transport system substrate-binding protein|uniref:Glycine/betaine ABC transporter substrate-binding protein n=1 Tax=Halocynthiibacter styelae TaxID=2761955 RepID=A0A8J7IFP9_9RHOB|nr:glycine betaine ABC transporter substrate-binding protein [Paenihalocynthiibacter styelae]MBI1495267.1 glycine/betaine ABC transporter substrate-binding protein [Paenihalocynthiibacter styelae]
MFKVSAGLGCVFAAAITASAAQANECGEVSIMQGDWGSAQIVTAVSKFLMEEGYGCDVTTIPLSSIPALASVAETGKPDILTEIWTNGAPAYQGLVDSGKIIPVNEVLSDGGVEGFFVPNYLVEEHPELATIEGIVANPELVGNRFHNSPEGWVSINANTNLLKASGLIDAGLDNFVHGSGETLAASIATAFEDKEPWFGFYWAPSSILGKYPMTLVELGPHDPEKHTCNITAECETPALSNYPQSVVTTVLSKDFMAENTEISDLMTNLSFTNAQMGETLAWVEDNQASYEEGAVHFLTTYNDVWGAWLNDAAREKLSPLLQ